MKRWMAALTVLILFVGFRQVQGAILPLDGTWTSVTEPMDPGDYFSDTWTFTSDSTVKFTITDILVISDQFEVYDSGSLVVTTPSVPDWDGLGFSSPFDFNPSDPDVALASGYFSSATILFAPGSHSIRIRDIHIPPFSGATPFADGTVAFKAEVVPEPAGVLVWGLVGVLGIGAGGWRRWRKRRC